MKFARFSVIIGLFVSLNILAGAHALGADDAYFSENITISVKKITLNRSFSAKAGQLAKIVVTNGPNGQRASSLKILLNGKLVVTRAQVNRNVASYTIANQPLLKKNSLRIIAKKNPATLKIEILPNDSNGGGGGDPGGSLTSRVIGYGDSLLAGFIDGTLVEHLQVWNFGSQIAAQANTTFVLPLIATPGLPTQRVGIVNGFVDVLPDGPPGGRINGNETLNNFAVPGASVAASLQLKALNGDPAEDIYTIVLGGNRTMLESVVARNPSLVLLWIGSNDVLDMIMVANPEDHTNFGDFSRDFETILKELKKKTRKVVVGNIPDITSVAFLIDPNNAPILGDFMRLKKLPVGSRVTATYFLDVILSFSLRNPREDEILLAEELVTIRGTVEQFNAEVSRLCSKHGFPMVDMYAASRSWTSAGINVGGHHLTTDFLGGMFGLDGLHPSVTAHAVIANLFIERINAEFGAAIPSVNVEAVYAQDPLRALAASRASLSDEVVIETLEAIGDYRALIRATREATRAARDQAITR